MAYPQHHANPTRAPADSSGGTDVCEGMNKLSANHVKEEGEEHSHDTQNTLKVSWHVTPWGIICLTAPRHLK